MRTFNAIYKCRLCGNDFANSCIKCDSLDLADLVYRLNEESTVYPKAGGNGLPKTIPHFCANGSIGMVILPFVTR